MLAVPSTCVATQTPPVTETPPVRSELVPPTPSPVHAWEMQRQRMPIRIAALSFDAAKTDTSTWPTLFEHTSTDAVADNVPFPAMRATTDGKLERQQEESDDGSSDDESPSCPVVPPQDVPRPPPGALHPSVGSERHAMGACRRCCFFPRGRCLNGYDCEFCHYEHDKRKRKNKTKKRAEASMMRMAPRAAVHFPPPAYGPTAAQRSWMFQAPHAPPQLMHGFGCGSMAHHMQPMLTPPAAALMGHRHVDASMAYPMMMQMQPQPPCIQQFVVAAEPVLPPATPTAHSQQFGRHVIQLPPAVSEQAGVPQAMVDSELSPPPPPTCSPNLPHICASSQMQFALPPPPPSASPRLTTRDAAM